jgi:tRNA U34 5-methylaminomethyl-2-thiouridine-forming methyltransferase MnmC
VNIGFTFAGMEREIVLTNDGSHTISIPGTNVTYHSLHGAIQESQHVFIEAGLRYIYGHLINDGILNVFEMGFGTGLNALLTLIEAGKKQQKIYYETIELFPLEPRQINTLNYCEQLGEPGLQKIFEQLHGCEWNREIEITRYFTFRKMNTTLLKFSGNKLFNLLYFDAFAPAVQPELWTEAVFSGLYRQTEINGALLTYCSKTIVRKAMETAGFVITKIPGPHGKRDMIRATKTAGFKNRPA